MVSDDELGRRELLTEKLRHRRGQALDKPGSERKICYWIRS